MNLVKYNVSNRIARITLNRPDKRNALSQELVSELKDAFYEAERDDSAKVIVLDAVGEAFCAGADLAYLKDLQGYSLEENLADSNSLKELFLQVYNHIKPVIAQVQGSAIAGGCGLATVCDFIYANEGAKFGYTEVKIGFVPALVMTFLIRKIGESRASELLLSGRLISAVEAHRIGMVHKICPNHALEWEVESLATKLVTGNSDTSMKLTKQLIKDVQNTSIEGALELAALINAKARATHDCQRGIAAFLNKEQIQW